jgi:hypothetical protein
MKKVEQYIKEHINRYSNHVELAPYITGFTEWLTIDDAKNVAKIAREETIKEVCEWTKTHLNDDYISVDEESVRMGCPYSYLETNLFIEDLKKHFKGKL